MKKFIYKTSFFILPFLFIYGVSAYFHNINLKEGDLIRLGYIYYNPCPKRKILRQFHFSKKYKLLSELNLKTKNKFDVVTIGDSFSNQGSVGYNNLLAQDELTVLHIDRFLSRGNQIQKLVDLINGDFFDYIQTDYIVLQSIEREFVKICEEIDYSRSTDIDSLIKQIEDNAKQESKDNIDNLDFFSDAVIKIPLTNFLYFFSDKPLSSKTYKVRTNRYNLFSNNPDSLLFYQDDVKLLRYKNDRSKIIKCNFNLNKINELLSNKNIKLIVLISPDKYDLYYQYIQNTQNFNTPLFFKYYDVLDKTYENVKAYEILSKNIEKYQDIYYYDDTHWTPFTANIIAKEIQEIITRRTN